METSAMKASDYGKYVCVGPNRRCTSGNRMINSDGVWIKGDTAWSSAHRGCVDVPVPSRGYHDEPDDLPVGSPYWMPYGAYGYWVVHERTVGDTSTRDVSGPQTTKKLAMAVSGALNAAYRQGLHDRLHRPDDRPCRERSNCPGWTVD